MPSRPTEIATGVVDPGGSTWRGVQVGSSVPVCLLMLGWPVVALVAGVRLKRTTCPVIGS